MLILFSFLGFFYWESVKNRRTLYERFAESKGANPLDPNFWYNLNATEIQKFKVKKIQPKL